MPNPNDIALNLARMRVEHSLSQEGLANILGLSRQAVSKWERGESVPDLGNLIALSDLYEVTVDELIRGPEEGRMTSHSNDMDAANENDAQRTEDGTTAEASEIHDASETDASMDAPSSKPSERFWQRWPRKTTLVVALCCLIALALIAAIALTATRDNGSPTPVAGRTAQESTDESERTEYNGRLMVVAEEQFDPQEVSSFHIDWYNGQARLLVSDETTTEGMILVRESSTMPLGDDERMQCSIKNGTLEVTSVNAGLLLDVPQHVDILVPTGLAKRFNDVSLTGLASDYSIEGITCTNMQANIPSDSSTVRTTNVLVENLGLSKNGRSNAVLEGSFEHIRVNQTSGAIKIIDSIQPEVLQATVNNGDLSITLPKDSAFALGADVSGGLVSCEFAQYETMSIYSGFSEKDVEAICCGRPGVASPLYELTARTSHITLAPAE